MMVPGSGEKTQRLNILISETLEKRLTSAAKKRGISKSAYVRLAVEREFDREQELELERAVRELAHFMKPIRNSPLSQISMERISYEKGRGLASEFGSNSWGGNKKEPSLCDR